MASAPRLGGQGIARNTTWTGRLWITVWIMAAWRSEVEGLYWMACGDAMVIGLRCHSNQGTGSSSFFSSSFSQDTASDITAYSISGCQLSILQHIVVPLPSLFCAKGLYISITASRSSSLVCRTRHPLEQDLQTWLP